MDDVFETALSSLAANRRNHERELAHYAAGLPEGFGQQNL
jgi:hypothetical protein